MLKGLAHVCFRVKDLDASVDFYVGKLGLKRAFDFINDDGERFGVYLHVGGRNFVELFKAGPGEPPSSESWQHYCIEVDDVKTASDELRSKGVEVTDPNLGSDGSWQSWIRDPDGNRIELHSYTADSQQNASLE